MMRSDTAIRVSVSRCAEYGSSPPELSVEAESIRFPAIVPSRTNGIAVLSRITRVTGTSALYDTGSAGVADERTCVGVTEYNDVGERDGAFDADGVGADVGGFGVTVGFGVAVGFGVDVGVGGEDND